jgi:8-oxo-dGTP pyrophosphatase MutT (NUDIX family)
MTESAQAAQTENPEEKEADHHPYYRPKDAATLILVDRTGAIPKVLVGRRHDKVVFMPGKFVFPGGRVDKTDHRVPVAAPITPELEANLLKGSPKISASRAKSLAIAAIREACEETGLCLGRKTDGALPKFDGAWKPFSDAGLLPDPSSLFLIARAITPRPGTPFRHALLHRRCVGHHPPRRRCGACGRRAGRARLGRARLAAARRSASHDQERARRIAETAGHRSPAP